MEPVRRKLNFRRPPVHNSVQEARAWRKRTLAVAFRAFARHGFDLGFAGHITVRDPELADHFWVNPLAMPFSHIRAADLLLVNEEGQVVQGDRPVNKAAFVIHSALHRARPDVMAACHAHTVHGRAWSTLGRLLDPITQDACAFYEDHAVYDTFNGVVFDPEDSRRMGEVLGSKKALILKNHGLLTVGQTVEEAAFWFISMEDCCRVQLLAEAAGKPQPIDEQVARATSKQTGLPETGWRMFQSIYDVIVRDEPDCLEDV